MKPISQSISRQQLELSAETGEPCSPPKRLKPGSDEAPQGNASWPSSLSGQTKNPQLMKRPSWSHRPGTRSISPQNFVLAPGGNPGGVAKTTVRWPSGGHTDKISEGTEKYNIKNRILSSFGVKILESDGIENRSSSVGFEFIKFLDKNPIRGDMSHQEILSYIFNAYDSSETLKQRTNSSFGRVVDATNSEKLIEIAAVAFMKTSCRSFGSYVLGKMFDAIPGLKEKMSPPVERAASTMIAAHIYKKQKLVLHEFKGGHVNYEISKNVTELVRDKFKESQLHQKFGANLVRSLFKPEDVKELIDILIEKRSSLTSDQDRHMIRRGVAAHRDKAESNFDRPNIEPFKFDSGYISVSFDKPVIQFGSADLRPRASGVHEKVKEIIKKVEGRIKYEFPRLYLQLSSEVKDSPVFNKGGIFGGYAVRVNSPSNMHKDSGLTSQNCIVCLSNPVELPTVYNIDNDNAEKIALEAGDVLIAPHGTLVHGNMPADSDVRSSDNIQGERVVLVLFSKPIHNLACKHPNVDYDSDIDRSSANDFNDVINFGKVANLKKEDLAKDHSFVDEVLSLNLDFKYNVKILAFLQERSIFGKLFQDGEHMAMNRFKADIVDFISKIPTDQQKKYEGKIKNVNNFVSEFGQCERPKNIPSTRVTFFFRYLEQLVDSKI